MAEEWCEYSVISHSSDKVAYAWRRSDEHYELRVVGIDDSSPKILAGDGLAYVAPRDWSGDGKQILAWFVKPNGDNQIVVVDVEMGETKVLKTVRQLQPGLLRFSADAEMVAYDRRVDPRTNSHDVFLLSVADGSEQTVAGTTSDERLLAWGKGGRILYSRRNRSQFSIYAIEIVNGRPKDMPFPVFAPFDHRLVESLGMTANGDYFFGAVDWVNTLYVAALDLQKPALRIATNVTDMVSVSGTADWSPDGRSLAWVEGVNSVYQPTTLVTQNVISGEETRVPLEVKEVHGFQPRWISREKLAFLGRSSTGRRTLFEIDAMVGEVRALADVASICSDGCATWYWENGGTEPNLFVTDGRSIEFRGTAARIGRDIHRVSASESISRLHISPDRRMLAFVVSDNATRVFVAPTRGGNPRMVHELDGGVGGYNRGGTRLSWLADSSGLLLSRSSGKAWNIGRIVACSSISISTASHRAYHSPSEPIR